MRIPILMYHSISDEPETGHPYYWINTSPKRFAEHTKFLHDNNYKVISLAEAVDIITSGNHDHLPSQLVDQLCKNSINGVDFGILNPLTRNLELPVAFDLQPATQQARKEIAEGKATPLEVLARTL